MKLRKYFTLDLPVYMITIITAFVVMIKPLVVTAEQVPKNPKDIITSQVCKPGNPDCPLPKCPPNCLLEMELSLIDASGKTQTSKGDKKTIQRQIGQFIDTSALNGRDKAQAKKQLQAIIAAVDDGTRKAKPEVTITCQGGPTTSPTGGTGGTATCGFTIKFGGGK